MAGLLDRHVLLVSGKGGVGRSTVAGAVALAAAERGRRTIVCEVAGQDRLARLHDERGVESGHEVQLAPNLWSIAIDPRTALREWLGSQLGSRRLAGILAGSSIFGHFAAAAPGTHEMATIIKVFELAQRSAHKPRARHRDGDSDGDGYDLVVVDAPATGHFMGMIRTPRTFARLARLGPIRRQADRVGEMLADPAGTAYLGVATAEELPVTETIDLHRRLSDELGRGLDAIVVNGLGPERYSGAELARLDDLQGAPPVAAAAMASARREDHRGRAQRTQVRRLRRRAEGPVVTLPYLVEGAIDLGALDRLGRALATKLDKVR